MAKKEEFFIDEHLGNLLDEVEKYDDVKEEETENEEGKETELTKEEIVALEKEKGDKLTEEELSELKKTKLEEKEEVEIPEDFSLIQPDKLPKELKPHFNKMLAAYTRKMEKVANVEKKAELWDYIQENPNFFINKFVPQQVETPAVKGESPEETFIKQLNIPEDHELAPALKTLALTLYKNITETKQDTQRTKEDSFKTSLKSWLDSNKEVKQDTELLKKMDELGMENPKLYSNLDRLKKFAETELGRPAKKIRENTVLDIVNMYKEMKKAKSQKVSRPSGESSVKVTKPKTVKEAFDLAESQLKAERK